jgi:exopolysaccharide biosynthesis protein
MGVLAEVMRYKERKDAEQAQAANAIPQAVQAFIQGRQQQVENQNSMLKNQIDAAKAGFRIENGGLVQDPTLMDAAQKNVLTIDDQGNLKVAGQVGKRDVVKQLHQSVQENG